MDSERNTARHERTKHVPRWTKRLKSQLMHLDPSDDFLQGLEVRKILKSWESKINTAAPRQKQLVCDWILANSLMDRILICHKELEAIKSTVDDAHRPRRTSSVEFGTKALTWTAPDAFAFLKSLGPALQVEEGVLFIAEVTTRDMAASDEEILSHGQQSIRIEAPSFTPAIQELAKTISSSSPCSVSFQLTDATANSVSAVRQIDGASHTPDDSEAAPAGSITKVGLTRHVPSSDIRYYTTYKGLGDYPAQLYYEIKIARDNRNSFPKEIPIHFAFNMGQSSEHSEVLRVGWSGETTDAGSMDWQSDFLQKLNQPVRVEETHTYTTSYILGKAFSRSCARSVTAYYKPSPFETTYLDNGFTIKELRIKPSATSKSTDWTNVDFDTHVSQYVVRSPRGLVSHCQAVYRHIPYAAESTRIKIGTEYVIVVEIDIPSIDDERTNIELQNGTDYVETSKYREGRSKEGKVQGLVEGRAGEQAETWFRRTIRRLRDSLPHDRSAEQEIGKTDIGSIALTVRVASMPNVRPRSNFRPQWYNLFAKGESRVVSLLEITMS